jgi:hypothetical protein
MNDLLAQALDLGFLASFNLLPMCNERPYKPLNKEKEENNVSLQRTLQSSFLYFPSVPDIRAIRGNLTSAPAASAL